MKFNLISINYASTIMIICIGVLMAIDAETLVKDLSNELDDTSEKLLDERVVKYLAKRLNIRPLSLLDSKFLIKTVEKNNIANNFEGSMVPKRGHIWKRSATIRNTKSLNF